MLEIGTRLINKKTNDNAKIIDKKNGKYLVQYSAIPISTNYLSESELLKVFKINTNKNYLLW